MKKINLKHNTFILALIIYFVVIPIITLEKIHILLYFLGLVFYFGKRGKFNIEIIFSILFLTTYFQVIFLIFHRLINITELRFYTELLEYTGLSDDFVLSLFFTISMVFSYFFSFRLEKDMLKIYIAMINEKKYHKIIKHYPNLMCSEHFSKISKDKILGINIVNCRFDKDCISKNLIMYPVKEIVGVIGNIEDDYNSNNVYYIKLASSSGTIFKNADYDVIEIRDSDEHIDYDSVIQDIYTYLYNDLQRFKPINKIAIRLVENPALSENSIRFLKEKFRKIEYVYY